MSRSALLARAASALSLAATVSLAAPASATDASDGMAYVPLDLLLHRQGQLGDLVYVVLGCRWADGKHQVALARPSQTIRCDARGPLAVYALARRDAESIQALIARDAGSPSEVAEAKKLLTGATACGDIHENTRVETSKQIELLTAHYAVVRSKTDCAVKKLGQTVPATPELRHPELKASATAPASPVSAEPAPAAADPAPAAPPRGGCSCGGCVAAPSDRIELLGAAAGLAVVLAALAARRRRRGGGTASSAARG